ncbi:MAG: hypothetical protein ACR2HJ_00190 [Fimbriimonadales bacterium]
MLVLGVGLAALGVSRRKK